MFTPPRLKTVRERAATPAPKPPASDDTDAPDYQSRRRRLIANTLKTHGASVDVEFVVNDVPHIVRRESKDGSLLIKIGGDEMRACTELEVRTLLPVQAYSQKQLSDVSVRIDELARFITAPIRSQLVLIQGEIDDRAEAEVREIDQGRLRSLSDHSAML